MSGFLKVASEYASRVLFLLILGVGGYIAMQPEFNMAHWTPNQTMRQLGIPYRFILAYEHYLPWMLHFFVALLLTLLLFYSKFYFRQDISKRISLSFFLMIGLILGNEIVQSFVGRNVQVSDLLVGLAGIVIATVFLRKVES